jgi:hypothetical protein
MTVNHTKKAGYLTIIQCHSSVKEIWMPTVILPHPNNPLIKHKAGLLNLTEVLG